MHLWFGFSFFLLSLFSIGLCKCRYCVFPWVSMRSFNPKITYKTAIFIILPFISKQFRLKRSSFFWHFDSFHFMDFPLVFFFLNDFDTTRTIITGNISITSVLSPSFFFSRFTWLPRHNYCRWVLKMNFQISNVYDYYNELSAPTTIWNLCF